MSMQHRRGSQVTELLHLLQMEIRVLVVLQNTSVPTDTVQLLRRIRGMLLGSGAHCRLIVVIRAGQLIHRCSDATPLLLLLLRCGCSGRHCVPLIRRSRCLRCCRPIPVTTTTAVTAIATALRHLPTRRLLLLLLLLTTRSSVRPGKVHLVLWTLCRVHGLHVLLLRRLNGHVQIVRLLILRLLHGTIRELLQVATTNGKCRWDNAGRPNRLYTILGCNVTARTRRRLQAQLTDIDVTLHVVV